MDALEIDALLAEARWLRRLAHSLVRDPTEADDLEQETWAAALAARPDPTRPLRPWLRTVLLNVIRMRHRGRARRQPRELEFETAREAPSTPAQLLQRAELERRLVEKVVALDEPYRSTVLLRYQEGLSAEEIARLQGVPAGTVRWRLKNALDRLRREMDSAPGGRAWRAVLAAPIAGRMAMGEVIVAKKSMALMWALMLLLLVAGGLLVARRARSGPGASSTPLAPLAGGGRTPAGRSGPASPGDLERLHAQPGLPPRRIAGHVRSDRAPVAGALVRLALADTGAIVAQAVSDADGGFDLGAHPAASYLAAATSPGITGRPVRVDLREPRPTPPSDDIVLVLTACEGLSGQVLDGSGGVIARARVSLAGSAWPATESDDRGRYDLCLPAGAATIEYAAEGYGGLLLKLEMNGPRMHDVTLVPESIVEGRVVRSEDGRPLAGALVRIEPNDRSAERGALASGVTDADGRFSVGGLTAGRSRVTALALDRATDSPVEIVTEAGRTLEGVVVPADPAALLSGQVVQGGRPLAGARLRLTVGGMLQADAAQAVTQEDGRFVIERVRRGELAVHVEDHEVVSPRGFRLTPGGGATDVRIEVRALGSIRGRVLRGGQPVAGAEVSCAGGRVTGEDGGYLCSGLDPGAHLLIARDAHAWGPVHGGLMVELARGEGRTVDLEMPYSAAICGTVVDQTGAPVAGVDVQVVLAEPADRGDGQTGADGRFCARRLLGGGTYLASVFLPGGRLHRFAAAAPFPPVRLAAADSRVDGLRLVVRREARAITGRVVDTSGMPVPDARIGAWLDRPDGGLPAFLSYVAVPTATSDEDGAFRIAGLPGARYALLARGGDGGEALVRPVAAGADGVVVTLPAAGRIEGRLSGFDASPPVLAVIADYHHEPIDAQVEGDRFHLSAVPAGTYVLTAADGKHAASTTVSVRAGGTATVILAARGTAAIAGRVIERTRGGPVAGLRCFAAPRAGDDVGVFYGQPDAGVVTDEAGRFALDPAPSGEVLVHCAGNAAASHGARALVLAEGERADIEVPVVARTSHDGTIGATLSPIRLDVVALAPGGRAEAAGIQLGDVVTAVDGSPIDGLSNESVLLLVTQRPVGNRARVTVKRGGAELTFSVAVAAAGEND